ncbi:MAG TPA: CBS domain-containing protein, partial [Steroidobacteraceae bacterium]|nr:CBS domain-containing protein [Steroidobacteraceae bacterium]
GADEPAGAVLRLFSGYPIHHLPVLSGDKVVGMLSSADVMKLDAFMPKTGMPPDRYLDAHLKVTTLMSTPVITIQAEQSLIDAATLMARHGFHALPVVDAQERLLGVITTTDIMHATLHPAPGGGEAGERSPTGAAFEQAINAARSAVDGGQDPQGIAEALLYVHKRLVLLERVLSGAERYLNYGQDHSALLALQKAITQARHWGPGGEVHAPLSLP